MLEFPTLSTGAVAQYPLPVSYTSPVEIIRFIDGTDQRFMVHGKTLRTWQIVLSVLNDDETYQLETFFKALGGMFSLFAFPDPYSGQVVPNCRMAKDSMMIEFLGEGLGKSSLLVEETNG